LQLAQALESLTDIIQSRRRPNRLEEAIIDSRMIARGRNLAAVNKLLMITEASKIKSFARIAEEILTTHPTSKLTISLNFIESINTLQEMLSKYDPLVLTGKIVNKKRMPIVREFDKNPRKRVLLMTTQTGGVGINLHDTVGNAPRFMLLSPSYRLLDLAQAANRIYRVGTKSDATVRIFYSKGFTIEEKILTSLAHKTDVLKGVLDDDALEEIILPGDYENEIEK